MISLDFGGLLGSLGVSMLGVVPAALLFSLLGVAVYGLAKRFGPATGALSALASLILLSLVPILALAPMPKWWTVAWTSANLSQSHRDFASRTEFVLPESGGPALVQVSDAGSAIADRTASPLTTSPLTGAAPGQAVLEALPEKITAPTLSIGWDQAMRLIGIVLVFGWCLALVRFAFGLRAIWRLRSGSLEVLDPFAIDLARSIARQLEFKGPVGLRTSAELTSAATVGWLHPEILLAANWQTWSHEELRAVLAHEIGHIARRDFAAWVLAQLSLTLHFYHPLAHWLLSRLRRDQELAADLLGAELCGGRQKYLVTLSHLVLRQTSRSAPLFSRPLYSARGTFLWRMKMLHANAIAGSAKLKRFPVSLLFLLLFLIGFASAGVGVSSGEPPLQEPTKTPVVAEKKGQIKGRITAAATGKPVEGAKVRVAIEGAPAPRYTVDCISDKDGQYSHDLPWGDARIFGVFSPAGYYTQDEATYDAISVTPEEPTVVRNFRLQTGKSWKVELINYAPSKKARLNYSARIDPERNLFKTAEIMHTLADAQGDGAITIPEAGGRYRFHCLLSETPRRFEIPPIDLNIQKGFDPAELLGNPEVKAEDGSVRLRDRSGNVATVTGAQVLNRNGQAVLLFPCKPFPRSGAFKVEGVIQQEDGKPISGAKISVALISYQGGNMYGAGMTQFRAQSTADGKFTIPELVLHPKSIAEESKSKIKIVVTKAGFNAEESKELHLTDIQKKGIADFGIIQLKAGKTLHGKVVDDRGNPVQGAVVRVFGGLSFKYSHLICRTDAKGQFAMGDFAPGKLQLWARYDGHSVEKQIDFNENSGELVIPIGVDRKE